jgi:hypothetical protein
MSSCLTLEREGRAQQEEARDAEDHEVSVHSAVTAER